MDRASGDEARRPVDDRREVVAEADPGIEDLEQSRVVGSGGFARVFGGWIWVGAASLAALFLIVGLLVIRRPNTIATYTGHTNDVLSVVQLDNGLIASASFDRTVQIWDPNNPDTTIATYIGHTREVLSVVQLDNGLIASAGSDRTVQIWDPTDPDTTIATYTGHTALVFAVVQLDNGLIASAGDDRVRIWDPTDPDTTIAAYTGHNGVGYDEELAPRTFYFGVLSVVQLDNGLIASGSWDNTVEIWDPNNPDTTIATYTGHAWNVLSVVQLDNGLIASASSGNTVKIWDPNNPDTTIATYTGHTNDVLSVVQLDNGLIASASWDDTVKIWDPNNP